VGLLSALTLFIVVILVIMHLDKSHNQFQIPCIRTGNCTNYDIVVVISSKIHYVDLIRDGAIVLLLTYSHEKVKSRRR
jgi:predicted nuclease of predicted toxin-antitoxin system